MCLEDSSLEVDIQVFRKFLLYLNLPRFRFQRSFRRSELFYSVFAGDLYGEYSITGACAGGTSHIGYRERGLCVGAVSPPRSGLALSEEFVPPFATLI